MPFLPNLTFLRYFYSACKHSSITKAAQENFVTQSAISQGIKRLEIELGRKLLSNRKNAFELTNDGVLLFRKSESIFDIFVDVEDLFNEKSKVYRGKLTFASSHSFALTLLPAYYQLLFQQYPEIEPVLRLGHAGVIREWIANGEIEFGIIVAREKDFLSFHSEMILQGRYGLYTAKAKKKPRLDTLLISTDRYEDAFLLEYLKKRGKKFPKTIEILSWEVIAGMVEQGLGVGILPDYVALRYNLEPLSITIPVVKYDIIAISSKNKGLTRNARKFIELISAKK